MIEDKLIFRRDDFLDLRESRRNPQQTSGIITAIKHAGVLYSFGVFPTSTKRSFVKAIENVNCYEILGTFNSIIIPYLNEKERDYGHFAEILAIQEKATGLINEFCFVREQSTGVYTPTSASGMNTLKQIDYQVVSEGKLDTNLAQILEEQKQSLTAYLSGISGAVKSH